MLMCRNSTFITFIKKQQDFSFPVVLSIAVLMCVTFLLRLCKQEKNNMYKREKQYILS